ncbi:MAG: DUF4012 domain-containing protein [Actinobacteria bacterium]|nr:DUF4012 domain-containing protein [Actinomycetota bacterium]
MSFAPEWYPFAGFLIALGAGLLLMPITIALARKFGFVVRPRLFKRGRRRSISYLGGIAVAASTLLGFGVLGEASEIFYFLLAGLLLMVIGFVDDRSGGKVPAWVRLVAQILVATLVAVYLYEGSLAKALFEIFLIVAVTNAFNLLDNMDGVAGTTAFATASSISFLAMVGGRPNIALTAACLAGASIAFLRHNFRSATSYLGNGGSLFIGFLIAALAVNTGLPLGTGWELVGAVLLLAVPTTDMFVVTIARFIHRKRLSHGGVDHVSHRLVRMGLSSRMAALLHGLAALVAGAMAYLASNFAQPEILVGAVAAFALAGIVLLSVRVYAEPKSWLRTAALAVSVTLLGFVLMAVAPTLSAASDLHSSRAHFEKGLDAFMAFQSQKAAAEFKSAGESARRAEETLGSFFTVPARALPIAGPNLRLARDLAEAADLLTPAALAGVEALSAFPRDAQNRPVIGLVEGRIQYAGWVHAKDYFDQAASAVRLALVKANAERGFVLPPLSSARADFVTKGNELLRTLEGASGLAEILPLISGADGPKTWFLAIQNPVELRATGGFLGAFGLLSADAGKISLLRLDSNLSLPPLPQDVGPEAVHARYDRFASNRMWQNVNMTPDFPTAAQQMMAMWEAQSGQKVDGVVAIDAVGLSHLLEVVGPVATEDFGMIDSENFSRVTLNEAYTRFPEKAERADVLLSVGAAAWSRLLSGTFENPLELRPLAKAVAERHVFAWSPLNPSAFSKAKASGALREPQDNEDFLMVVGQNAAANKIDYYMKRTINYQVKLLPEGRSESDLQVAIANTAPKSGLVKYIAGPYLPTDPAGLNRSYTSVYVPLNRGVISAQVNGEAAGVESHQEKGLAVFSNHLEALPGETSAMHLSLAGGVHRPGEYVLHVQKQPTLRADDFTVEVTIPSGMVVTGMTSGMTIEGDNVRWNGTLDTDKKFVVRYGNSLVDRIKSFIQSDSDLAISA